MTKAEMPAWAKARQGTSGDPAIKQWADALKRKLFGVDR